MLVFLSKLLPTFVYPIGLVTILIVAALFLRRRERLQRAILIAALALLFVGGNRYTALALVHSLESRFRPPDPLPQVDAIVLLGGGTESREPPRQLPEVNGAGDRIVYAAWLYQQEAAPVVLVSGGLIDWDGSPTTPADDMADLLKMMGVPQEAMWLQPRSRNTEEDALYSAEMLRARGAQRILLVTSAWHMPRSVRLFEAQGLQVIAAPADFLLTDRVWDNRWSLEPLSLLLGIMPTVDNLALTTRMMKEYLGMIYYQVRGVD